MQRRDLLKRSVGRWMGIVSARGEGGRQGAERSRSGGTSEWTDTTFGTPCTEVILDRSELCPLPMILPPRTSSAPCLIWSGECCASSAAREGVKMGGRR